MGDEKTTMEMLAGRVDALERQNRRLRRAFVTLVPLVALALVAGVAALAQAPAKAAALLGDKITLVDVADRTTATLENVRGQTPMSNPMLTFFDRAGNGVVRLGIGDRGPILEVTDRQGRKHDYFGGPTVRPATQ